MKRWIKSADDQFSPMTEREINILRRIPLKYRKHIVDLTISESGCYNDRGRELLDYTITWDNGDEHTFQNIDTMLYMLKEYNVDGYYVAP